uniref:C2H2-type domain-containing protein n=1 Tax=Panagrolaimus sp. PS1159 TaxID=55785 RepID=A0AC35FQG7_9BILA
MSSQDNVIVISDDEDEEEEKYVKIHYQDSEKFLEVFLEGNRNILFNYITCMDSKIDALIIEKEGSKRIVKLVKDGFMKEPKEKWKSVNVYAVLKREHNDALNGNLTGQNKNKMIKSETTTTVLTDRHPCSFPSSSNFPTNGNKAPPVLNGRQPDYSRSLPSSSNFQTNDNKVMAEALTVSTPGQSNNHEPPHPTQSSTSKHKNDNTSQVLNTVTVFDDSDDDEGDTGSDNDVDESADKEDGGASDNCLEEPTDDKLFSVYKVSSLAALKVKLCRGYSEYYDTFDAVLNRFKRTMIANPNNEIVRLMHFAQTSSISMHSLDLNAKDCCELCEKRLILKHLVSSEHAEKYQQKYNADPPEIATLLGRQIYRRYIDPLVLASLNIFKFKKMEESSTFFVPGSCEKLIVFKYILINRLLQGTLVMRKGFSFKKLIFLRNNLGHRCLKRIFTTKSFECRGCKSFSNSLHDYLQHILSDNHLQKALNQEELYNICKATFMIHRTPTGYQFLTMEELSRKRQHSSQNIQNGISKRHKKS